MKQRASMKYEYNIQLICIFFSFQNCPCSQQSRTNTIGSWRTSTLNAPDNSKEVIDTAPVAPPRKKRTSTNTIIAIPNEEPPFCPIRNGFKDVFGSEELRRMSTLSIYKEAMAQNRIQVSHISRADRIVETYEVDVKDDEFTDFSQNPTVSEKDKPKVNIPKVGNKKSDKFFGENLSDSLSDVPYTTDKEEVQSKDNIDTFVERNIFPTEVNVKIVDNKSSSEMDTELISGVKDFNKNDSLDNKAKFLMTMLEDYSENEKYKNKEPVDEMIIVPKKRPTRHICDHDGHMYTKFYNHERSADGPDRACVEWDHSPESRDSGPKKPDRDFSRYRNSIEGEDSSGDGYDQVAVQRPNRMKRKTLSRENLPSPPALPYRDRVESAKDKKIASTTINVIAVPSEPPPPIPPKHNSKKARSLLRNISLPVATNQDPTELIQSFPQDVANNSPKKSPESKEFRKCQSSNTFLTEELMAQIVKKALGFTYYTPEDFPDHHHDDYDGSVGPTSTIEGRKISTSSRPTATPTCTPMSSPTEEKSIHLSSGNSLIFSIGDREIPRKKKISFCDESPVIIESPNLRSEKVKEELILNTSLADKNKNYNIEELFAKKENDFQNRPQKEKIVSNSDLHSLIGSSKVLDIDGIQHVFDQIYDENKTILEDFQIYLEDHVNEKLETIEEVDKHRLRALHTPPPNPIEKKEINEYLKHIEDESIDDIKLDLIVDEDLSSNQSELDDCFDKEFEKIENDIHFKPKFRRERRESIEDMDDWFANQAGFESTHPDGTHLRLKNKGRRSSDGLIFSTPAWKIHQHGKLGSHEASDDDIQDIVDSEGEHIPVVNKVLKSIENNARLGRRGSDGGILNYDTSRLYPFGKPARERRDSLSTEFFEGLNDSLQHIPLPPQLQEKSNSDDEFNKDSDSNDGEEPDKPKGLLEINLHNGGGPDHSTLLKIIREKETEGLSVQHKETI